jgi:hypothetical protein
LKLQQAIDEDEGSSDDESEEESSSSEDEPEVEQKPKKGRILKAFEDSDDETNQKINTQEVPGRLQEATETPDILETPEDIVMASEPASDALFTTQDVVKTFGAAQDDLFDSPVMSDARTIEDIFSTQPCK